MKFSYNKNSTVSICHFSHSFWEIFANKYLLVSFIYLPGKTTIRSITLIDTLVTNYPDIYFPVTYILTTFIIVEINTIENTKTGNTCLQICDVHRWEYVVVLPPTLATGDRWMMFGIWSWYQTCDINFYNYLCDI